MTLLNRCGKALFTILTLIALTACGGGGGGGSSNDSDSAGSDQTFSVSLSSVDVRRLSDDSEVSVDTSSVSSGDLVLSQ